PGGSGDLHRLHARAHHPGADPVSATEGATEGAARAGEAEVEQSAPVPAPAPASPLWTVAGLVVVFRLAALVGVLTDAVPAATEGTGFGRVAKSIESPVYAIALGFAGNAVLSLTGVRQRMAAAFRTEFFIKIGLVLLGATINFAVVARAA